MKPRGYSLAAHSLNGMYQCQGFSITVMVCPCSWIYPNYGLQIEYCGEENRFDGLCKNKEIKIETVTREEIQELIESSLVPYKCTICDARCLCSNSNPSDKNTNGMCNKCFSARARAELDQELATERERLIVRDRKALERGYNYRANIWVHPPTGDDYLVVIYSRNCPSDQRIKALLKRRKSQALHDYNVVNLVVNLDE